MNKYDDPKEILIAIFFHLRKKGFDLGISELLAALQAVDKWKITDKTVLCQTAKLIWCSSLEQRTQFEVIWNDLFSVLFEETIFEKYPQREPTVDKLIEKTPKLDISLITQQPITEKEDTIPDWKVLPVCAPEYLFGNLV